MQNHCIFIIVTPEEIERTRRLIPDKSERGRMRAEAEERLNQKKLVRQKLKQYFETGDLPDEND